MAFLNIQIIGDAELKAKLTAMPQKVAQSLYRKVTELALMLENYVKTQKLSGQVLQHRTGHLQQSIHSDSTASASSVVGRVFSAAPMPYAAIHEFGGVIPAHIIRAKNALALHFMSGGKDVFAKYVNMPDVNMPARSYMRSSLADNKDKIIEGMKDAVSEGLK